MMGAGEKEEEKEILLEARRGRRHGRTTAPPPRVHPLSLATDPHDPLSSFILVVLDWVEDEHPCNVLSRSAGFCKMPCQWDYRQHPEGTLCSISIDRYEVSSAVDGAKSRSLEAAAKQAVEALSKRCYTIKVKNKYLGDGTAVDNVDLNEEGGGGGGGGGALGSDNVGHRLLRLMGWSGGGLGKGGAGISEPVTATAMANREGLGSSSTDGEFKRRVRSLIEEYAASSNPYDLVFTSGFSNDQRKEMHLVAKRLGLKSKSFGKGEDRFLTISRKTDGRGLLRELLARGGQSEKYELLPPQMI